MKIAIIFLVTCTFPGFFSVLTLENIYNIIENLISTYPKYVSLIEIGRSIEGKPIQVVSIRSTTNANTTIVVEFGIHAREWASPRSALFLLEQLITNPECTDFRSKINWYVIPVANPDGFSYSVTDDPMWRKNRRTIPGAWCKGVDLNRNFPVGWESILSLDSCSETYSGPYNFSEPEAIALNSFMTGLTLKNNVSAYVAVHSCAQCILHPYGYTLKKLPRNLETLKEVGMLMRMAMQKVAGYYYPVKSAGELYIAGGGSDDWAHEMLAIPLVYTLELGYDRVKTRNSCFQLEENFMNTLVLECFAALGAVAKFLEPSISHNESSTPSYPTSPNRTCPDRNSVGGANSTFSIVVLTEAILLSILLISK